MPFDATFESRAKEGCTSTVATLLPQVFQRAADRSLLLDDPPLPDHDSLDFTAVGEEGRTRGAEARLGVDFERLEKQGRQLGGVTRGSFAPRSRSNGSVHSHQEAEARSGLCWSVPSRRQQAWAHLGRDRHRLRPSSAGDASRFVLFLAHCGINYQGAREGHAQGPAFLTSDRLFCPRRSRAEEARRQREVSDEDECGAKRRAVVWLGVACLSLAAVAVGPGTQTAGHPQGHTGPA